MSLVDEISAQGYALVKRNPRLKYFVSNIYHFISGMVMKIRSAKQSPNTTPVNACISVKKWIECSTQDNTWYKEIYPASNVHRSLPETIGPVHWKFIAKQSEVLPATFVASLQDAMIVEDGKIITTDNQLLTEVSKEIVNGEYHDLSGNSNIYTHVLPFPEKLHGSIAVLSAPSGRGYYHWMFDVIPRLELIRKSGVEWSDIDYFIVNDYVAKFHIESFQKLGIDKRKIKASHWHPYIQSERLILPSLVGNTGHIPEWPCRFLRSAFISNKNTKGKTSRLYLSRGQVAHRKVINEHQVIEVLSGFDFVSVSLESLSLADQVALLQHASVVVAPHGAGLTNIVFCEPGTKIIEILSPNAVNIMYWTLCNQIDLKYYYLLAEGPRPPEFEDRYDNSENLRIDTKALTSLLEIAGVQ